MEFNKLFLLFKFVKFNFLPCSSSSRDAFLNSSSWSFCFKFQLRWRADSFGCAMWPIKRLLNAQCLSVFGVEFSVKR